MKRIFIILCLLIIGLSHGLTAHPVDQENAKDVASKFMETNDLQLVTIYQTDQGIPAFYVFNTTDGFVIVSADDCETPIIGYSHEGRFDLNTIPKQLKGYLQDFVERIQYGIETHVEADEFTVRQWELVKTTGRLNDHKVSQSVLPLLNEVWSQGCYYNSLCPVLDRLPCGHAEVGCVAVAMGQIMHYWNYPSQGWGSNSYTNAGTVLSADFGNTIYDWKNMPDSLTENSNETEIEAVATLLYHCGISVNMEYGISGSGAESKDVPNALIRYFNYSRQLHREKQSNFSNEEWLSMLKDNLDIQRPVYYSGNGHGSHAFVCDGYDNNDLLHFNWGWSGHHNGYFALGNLNPNGYNFSSNNFAILDIFPQYDPYVVEAIVYPPAAGSVEGLGEYHLGEHCTLTAIPKGYDFYCWKRNGKIISQSPSITLPVEDDIINLEAHFSGFPIGKIGAIPTTDMNQPNSSSVSLSWTRAHTEWELLKRFKVNKETSGLATDGKHIYVAYGAWVDSPFMFEKYTMNGDLVESFNLDGIPDALSLAYDGTYFYCNSLHAMNSYSVLYQVDLENRTIIDSTEMGTWFGTLAYDPGYDGFWLGKDTQLSLYDRQGQLIKISPTTWDYINGMGCFLAEDETPHLLLVRQTGVYDYDVTSNYIFDRRLLDIGVDAIGGIGACTARYNGKDAMFLIVNDSVCIYEIKSAFAQIIGYRLYRSNSENDLVMLADGVGGSTYIDDTWDEVPAGVYRYGISSVYANGNESKILWSDPITSYHGIIETPVPQNDAVQKIVEDGQLYLLVKGKKYNVMGQSCK